MNIIIKSIGCADPGAVPGGGTRRLHHKNYGGEIGLTLTKR